VNDEHDEAGMDENGGRATTESGAPESWKDPKLWERLQRDRAKGAAAAANGDAGLPPEAVEMIAHRAYLDAKQHEAEADPKADADERAAAKRATVAAKAKWDRAKLDRKAAESA
jgi:hypothetical protein